MSCTHNTHWVINGTCQNCGSSVLSESNFELGFVAKETGFDLNIYIEVWRGMEFETVKIKTFSAASKYKCVLMFAAWESDTNYYGRKI